MTDEAELLKKIIKLQDYVIELHSIIHDMKDRISALENDDSECFDEQAALFFKKMQSPMEQEVKNDVPPVDYVAQEERMFR